jgi:hypothetical protein
MKNRLVNGILVSAILLAASCNMSNIETQSYKRQEKAIERPLSHIKEQATVLNVDPHQGGEFYLKTGTVLTIPQNAFVDQQGNPLTEPVQIKMQEFHSASEILLSGITMHYEENGVNESFESAGMFSIEGSCEGKEIKVAEGKSLNLELASRTDDFSYDFFQLDTATANWVKVGATSAIENRVKKNLKDSIEKIANAPSKIEIPEMMEAGAVLLDIDVDYRKYPQLKDFYGLAWQVDSSENVSEISNAVWEQTTLVSTGKGLKGFKLMLSAQDQIKEVKVQPVISKQERERLEKKIAEARKTEAEEREKFLADANKKYESIANFQRNVAINGFGVFNCDRAMKYEEPITLEPTFFLEGKQLTQLPPYYLISNDNSAVSQYHSSFKIDAKRKNSLLFLLGEGQMAFVSNKQLLDLANNSKYSSPELSLELQPVG